MRTLNDRFRYLVFIIAILCCSESVFASEPVIAVASNFKSTMIALVSAETDSSHQAKTIYASSGKLLAQITNGAPIDIFLSAEPIGEKLDANLVVEGSEFTYAYGQLALVSSKSSQQISLESAQRVTCLAIANPRLAPYGRAAMEVIEKLKHEGWRFERIVQGQSVAQAFQFFDSGACDTALVAYPQVRASKKPIPHLLIPSDLHRPIQQNAVLLKRSENNPEALKFFEFLQSETARNIIQDAGYLTDIE